MTDVTHIPAAEPWSKISGLSASAGGADGARCSASAATEHRQLRRVGPEFCESLEVRIKSINYIGDLLLEELKRFHDKRGIVERYLCGEIESHHHWSGHCAKTVMVDAADHREKAAMLVGVGQFAQNPGPLTAVTRLQPLERCLVSGGQPVNPHFAELVFGRIGCGYTPIPALFRIFDHKLRDVRRLTSVQIEKLIDEVIEGGSEVVDRLPDENGEDWGRVDVPSTAKKAASDHCRDRTVRRHRSHDLTLKGGDVLLRPTYSRTRIIEGWLFAIGAHSLLRTNSPISQMLAA